MHNRKYYFHQMIHNNEFEEQIERAILKHPNEEKETISVQEIERWVAEDKERRRIKNRFGRIVSKIVDKARLR